MIRLHNRALQQISKVKHKVLPDCFQAPGGHIKRFPRIDGQLCNLLCLRVTADTPISVQHRVHCIHRGLDKAVCDSTSST